MGTKATVVDQQDKYTVTVEVDGKERQESTARVSPVPAAAADSTQDQVTTRSPRPVRLRRMPQYLDDYVLG